MPTSSTAAAVRNKPHRVHKRPPFECIALLLQGGGALGAYQAGVYEALAEAGLHPDWTAGISIGSINAAIIAGNAPEDRVGKLDQFWRLITAPVAKTASWPAPFDDFGFALAKTDTLRQFENQVSAGLALMAGVAGFYMPRIPNPWLWPEGSFGATSYYDTSLLKSTLESVIDFDRINAGGMRLSMGAVNVTTGNFTYFDTTTHKIRAEHVMASGALPPGFPAVEVDGEYFWDGGLISNTPLTWVMQSQPKHDTLAFQVDLWSARGKLPRNMPDVATRQKEIQFSSRTRSSSDRFKQMQSLRNDLASLLSKLPEELKHLPEVATLTAVAERKVYNLVQLIYRSRVYEGDSKDYEFSARSMRDHWRAGHRDTVRSLRNPDILKRPTNREGVAIFDEVERHPK